MHKPDYRLIYFIIGSIVALDQLTKILIQKMVSFGISYFPPERIEIIEGFFYIVHIGNEGAAWGLFSQFKELLIIFSFAMLFLIYFARRHFQLEKRRMQIAFGFLIGGILGNLIDRIRMGYVIDFIDIHLPFSVPGILPLGRWPAFNIADSSIVIGLVIYLLLSGSNNQSKIH